MSCYRWFNKKQGWVLVYYGYVFSLSFAKDDVELIIMLEIEMKQSIQYHSNYMLNIK